MFKAEFLQISTSNKLYVYDLRQLNTTALFNDLRPILENQAYLKIVFDSRLLFDNLKHHYNLKIAPVCDIALNTNREFKDLNHCVEEIFGIKMHNSEQKVIFLPTLINRIESSTFITCRMRDFGKDQLDMIN